MRIFAISGSLRNGSFNTALLRAAEQVAPDDMEFDHYEGLAELPHYNQDLDTDDPPEVARDLRERIIAADGVLIATPEYNYSIPGGLKNAIDWASRPAASSALLHKPVAIMGAAPTNFGSVRAQLALRQCFVWIDSRVVVKPEVIVFRAGERFDDQGHLTDPATAELVTSLLLALRHLIESGD
ncbi:MAG: NADPH-dependent FMN reductase [Candidatus Nanopelagicales bacterium]